MFTITASSILRDHFKEGIASVKESDKPLLISNKGKIVAGLVGIDFLEDLMELRDGKYVQSIKDARREIKEGKFITHEDLLKEI